MNEGGFLSHLFKEKPSRAARSDGTDSGVSAVWYGDQSPEKQALINSAQMMAQPGWASVKGGDPYALWERHVQEASASGFTPYSFEQFKQAHGYNTGGLVGFIKDEEGWRNKAYQGPGGVWTIGYGRTRNPDGSTIKPGQTTSREKEDSWLTNRIDTVSYTHLTLPTILLV